VDLTDTELSNPALVQVAARMTRIGFARPDLAAELVTTAELGLWEPNSNAARDDGAAAIVSAIGRTADPDQALASLAELARSARGPELLAGLRSSGEWRNRLLDVLGVSSALAEHVIAYPQDAFALRDRMVELDSAREAIVSSAADADADAIPALRRAYRRELLRVAAGDLAGEWDLQQVTEALSDLAASVLQAGLAVAERTVLAGRTSNSRLAIIAMGKAGGRELNYVSDVDVIFVAEPLGDVPEWESLETATRLAAETIRICGLVAWEVDAALRPEGKSGPLVRTVASHEAYYRRWASTWEFQALLKARPIAGDLELGQRYIEAVTPLIWTAAERPDFVADVQAMRRRVVEHLPPDIADRELKLGPGGLRDVEFAVQLLQLVHGRADSALRERATLPALAALREGGYVGRDDANSLSDAYAFLRSAEHRLQLARLRRTHLVPESGPALMRLARSLGFRADSRGDPVAVWHSEWALHVREVRRLHEKLFYRPLLDAVARVPSEALRLTPVEAGRRMQALGYADPAGALRHLDALTAGVSRRAALQRTLLPVILSYLAESPDPDAGLLAYRQVSDALGSTPWFLRLLRDEGAVASRLAIVLGTSKYVTNLLVHAPEALQMLADDEELVPRRSTEIAVIASTAARRQDDLGQAAHAIRSVRRIELLRIAFAQLIGVLSDSEVRIGLTELADATLAATLDVARRFVAADLGVIDLGIDFAVIAMGRLGGQELGYGSDADAIFVFDATSKLADSEAASRAIAVAESLRSLLAMPSTDPPLLLDANLRPEGRNGPLARSLSSYAEYYARWSSVWESQALLRARFCAGDPELGDRFIRMIDELRYPDGGLAAADVVEIRRIKARVDAERLPRGADPHTHTKLGRGGLSDVEWTVQLLQLRHAYRVPGLRTTATVAALRAAADAHLMSADEAASLEAAWRLASRARDAIMLVRDKADDQLPKPGRVLNGVGRVLGYRPGFEPGQLLDDYRRAARRARRVVETVFYDSAG